ncbi:MAG: RNA 2',3'-cyclic phosphodiesterase [Polymorphobacter sp.]
MHRLFVAIELPVPVRDALVAMMGGIAGARWQKDEQLHLTLRFIGEVDRHRAADIAATLGGVNIQSFDLTLDGIGTFDRRGRIDALWAGVTPKTEVAGLARRVDAALARIGLPPETRAFQPHITIARFGKLTGPIDDFPAAPVPALSFTVSGFALWKSQLGHDGADYQIVERYRAATPPFAPIR